MLNCSSFNVNWNLSNKTKESVIQSYKTINKKLTNLSKVCKVYDGNLDFGVNHHRRETYRKFWHYDYVIYLDSDVVFSSTILTNYIKALASLNKSAWNILTPQTLKLWDSTWDPLVNEKYLSHKFNSYKNINISQIHSDFVNLPRILAQSNIFKFGGGWFTAISTKLLNFISIPPSFGSYGPDDTFLMNCLNLMKKRNYNVSQFILKNEIIKEQPINNNDIIMKTNSRYHRELGMKNFFPELLKFEKKL
jgi:hypothetical protein